MKSSLILGVVAALGTGLAIGVQSTLSSRLGPLIGDLRTGLLMNVMGGIIAALITAGLMFRYGQQYVLVPRTALLMLVVAGALGVGIITGAAYSLPRIGIAAGLATIILAQLLISVLADTTGVGHVEPIPLTLRRVSGLLVMAVAVYLLLPTE